MDPRVNCLCRPLANRCWLPPSSVSAASLLNLKVGELHVLPMIVIGGLLSDLRRSCARLDPCQAHGVSHQTPGNTPLNTLLAQSFTTQAQVYHRPLSEFRPRSVRPSARTLGISHISQGTFGRFHISRGAFERSVFRATRTHAQVRLRPYNCSLTGM